MIKFQTTVIWPKFGDVPTTRSMREANYYSCN